MPGKPLIARGADPEGGPSAGAGNQRDRPGEQAHHRGDGPGVVGNPGNFRRGLGDRQFPSHEPVAPPIVFSSSRPPRSRGRPRAGRRLAREAASRASVTAAALEGSCWRDSRRPGTASYPSNRSTAGMSGGRSLATMSRSTSRSMSNAKSSRRTDPIGGLRWVVVQLTTRARERILSG
jgi:hypothetical protein